MDRSGRIRGRGISLLVGRTIRGVSPSPLALREPYPRSVHLQEIMNRHIESPKSADFTKTSVQHLPKLTPFLDLAKDRFCVRLPQDVARPATLRSKLAPHPVCRSNVLGNPPLRGLYGAPLTVLHLVRRDEGFSAHGLHDSQVPLAPVACVSRDLFRPSSRVGFTLDQERRKMRRISRLIGQVRSHHDLAAGIYEHLGVVSLNKALVGAFHDPRFRVCKVPLGSRLRLGFGRSFRGWYAFPAASASMRRASCSARAFSRASSSSSAIAFRMASSRCLRVLRCSGNSSPRRSRPYCSSSCASTASHSLRYCSISRRSRFSSCCIRE